jgi:pimeloyl-ACP methyl ester carboxylesterase
MPGWGRSERPEPSRFDYSMYGLSAFLEGCLEELGVTKRKLVVHDWGGVAIIGAQRRPELLERLVVINTVPLTGGYRWHWIAQIWRRRPWGELFNRLTNRSGVALLMRQAKGDRGPFPPEFVDMIWDHWDKGTGDAVLALYRHADPDRIAAAGRDLGRLDCPALVVWGERDPYLPIRFGEAFAEALPNSELDLVAGAGHWPWIDDVRVVDRVCDFVA